jgi:hypothetical protein
VTASGAAWSTGFGWLLSLGHGGTT